VAHAETALCQAVRESPLCVALFDLSTSRVLTVSASGVARLGLVDVDLSTFDFIESSADPAAVSQLVSLIRTRALKEWSWRSLLWTPDGRREYGIGTGRVVGGLGSRVVCLARYHWPALDSDEAEARDAALLLESEAGEIGAAEVRREERMLAERVARLERHLDRIGQEVQSAGRIPIVSAMPQPSAVPGLTDLSARQWEVVTRLLRGERVPTIARGMFLSPSTVRNHLSTIYRKVGVSSQTQLLELLHGGLGDDGPMPSSDGAVVS
jgi:DNA-binding CsgD family transcriptional regulator